MDSTEDGIEVNVRFWSTADIGGSVGGEKSEGLGDIAVEGALGEVPSLSLFSASAWRFGGPRRLLGLS
jgi:hypothetical protein